MAIQTEVMTELLLKRWEQVSEKIHALGEELPEDAIDWSPVAGVRSVGEVLRHVAFWNQYVADTLRGEKADDAGNELPVAEYSTKAKILAALAETSGAVTAALRDQKSLDASSAELVIPFIEHTSEHYGQLVVYRRLLGTVPDASQV